MKKNAGIWSILFFLTMGIALWYVQLKEHQKEFVKNLLRQAPDLPGRYMV